MTIIYLILAALALGVLVLIHELGHLLAAKSVGMAVESFSIGFGPALYKKKIRNIEYRIGVFPFGGYVRIKGMDKKEKGVTNQDSVYDIPHGFFSKSPWKRIFVLIAGPLANILLAFIVFGALYICGGRTKAYSEYSNIVGWAHPVLRDKGLKLGDEILTCNNKSYFSDKDAITAALLDGYLSLQGLHPAYLSNDAASPFAIDTEFNVNKLGIPLAGASYLLYRYNEPIVQHSPMADVGMQAGDRLVWMDGELLFSPVQISQMLEEAYAFIKVLRNDQELFLRIPRVRAGTLYLSSYVRNELIDNQYEAGIKGKWSSLYTIPYIVNSYGYIEGQLDPIDPESSFPHIEKKLELGDRILAIDSIPVSNSIDILRLLQDHKVSIIVQSMTAEQLEEVDTSIANQRFLNSYNANDLLKIIQSLGSKHELRQSGVYRLLPPIQPKPWISIYSDKLLNQRREVAKKLRNQEQRRYYLEKIEMEKQRMSLGIPLQDANVKYNPFPGTLMWNIFKDSLRTIQALIFGRLHLQWLSGPIGIVHMLHKGWSLGLSEALFWIGLVSMNLSVLNLLPIPILDGGYIVLCLWEIVTRRRLNMQLVEKLLIPFSLLLIIFFIVLTFQDVFRLFVGI
ncbi:site-2 protease family protein [Chlamydia gallinacea]|uniref:Zinc metalloprotease n=2 Tax=Chlamydia gallinacea TaxID=1457153 RepID=A0A173DZW4_9CHLA|nr:site-2 protease family protein [Chlamydia gallinacea]EYE60381.1 RIP metalloprotease RseP [Bacteroides fragilis str. S6L5]ANG66465.1 zinc metalloprotease [Chlamydia gallinacea 08-1274/3]AQT77346.1 zinc metalloprotease [Chlamydia gallinacea]MBX6679806.1 site-2 protease family protein [Chlamydia gallinacea]MBX6687609.1 site-2 protease family protein [Chlamydia gallinacea]